MRSIKPACALIASSLAAAVAAPAHGAPISDCGNYGPDERGRVGWTYDDIHGAGISNVTTRKVRCTTARRFVRRYRGTDSYFPTWRCREVNEYESSDIRCTASRGRVIRWQAGA
jgi:hypothetical protein